MSGNFKIGDRPHKTSKNWTRNAHLSSFWQKMKRCLLCVLSMDNERASVHFLMSTEHGTWNSYGRPEAFG